MDPRILVYPPLYLLSTTARCWRCGKPQPVLALSCHNLRDGADDMRPPGDRSELLLLSYIAALPPAVLQELRKRNDRYQLAESRTLEDEYYANTCACGTFFGDHHLFFEPGGAFFPEAAVAAAAITLETLVVDGALHFDCTYSLGDTGQLILAYARRVGGTVAS